MAERVGDLDDVRDRAVARLLGQPMPGVPERDTPFVLVADDLAPADTVTLTPERVLALVTVRGGPTSHTAILARSLGLPAVVACAGGRDRCARASSSRSTARTGEVRVGISAGRGRGDEPPRSGSVARRGPPAAARAGRPTATRSRCSSTSATPPGRPRSPRSMPRASGLFRTEFLYLDRQDAPSVDEQVALYTGVFEAMGGRKIVVRTLDAGRRQAAAVPQPGRRAEPGARRPRPPHRAPLAGRARPISSPPWPAPSRRPAPSSG